MPDMEIPLFPLNTVLFPDGVLPLKIFEPRYLDMIGRCKDDAFFIGGGAYTFQRRLLSLHPHNAYLYSAEIDPAVTKVAMEHLGLAPNSRHRILHEDGLPQEGLDRLLSRPLGSEEGSPETGGT